MLSFIRDSIIFWYVKLARFLTTPKKKKIWNHDNQTQVLDIHVAFGIMSIIMNLYTYPFCFWSIKKVINKHWYWTQRRRLGECLITWVVTTTRSDVYMQTGLDLRLPLTLLNHRCYQRNASTVPSPLSLATVFGCQLQLAHLAGTRRSCWTHPTCLVICSKFSSLFFVMTRTEHQEWKYRIYYMKWSMGFVLLYSGRNEAS